MYISLSLIIWILHHRDNFVVFLAKVRSQILSFFSSGFSGQPGDSDLGNGGIKLLRKYNVVRKPKKISPDSFTEKVRDAKVRFFV